MHSKLKQTIFRGAAAFAVMTGLVFAPVLSGQVAALECGGVKTSIIGCSAQKGGSGTDSGIWAVLLIVLNVMTAGVGILAVGGIVYGAILYATAEDKADQTKKAISIINNVVVGIIAYGLMYLVLNFLVPGGIFN